MRDGKHHANSPAPKYAQLEHCQQQPTFGNNRKTPTTPPPPPRTKQHQQQHQQQRQVGKKINKQDLTNSSHRKIPRISFSMLAWVLLFSEISKLVWSFLPLTFGSSSCWSGTAVLFELIVVRIICGITLSVCMWCVARTHSGNTLAINNLAILRSVLSIGASATVFPQKVS